MCRDSYFPASLALPCLPPCPPFPVKPVLFSGPLLPPGAAVIISLARHNEGERQAGRQAGVAGKLEEERGFANPSRLSWVISHLWSALYLSLDALGLHCRGVKSVRAPRLASPTRAKTGYILHSMRSGSDKPPSHPKGGRLERVLYDSSFFLPFISWLIIGLGSKSTLLPVILSSSPPRQFVNLGIVLGGELYRDSPASQRLCTYIHAHTRQNQDIPYHALDWARGRQQSPSSLVQSIPVPSSPIPVPSSDMRFENPLQPRRAGSGSLRLIPLLCRPTRVSARCVN